MTALELSAPKSFRFVEVPEPPAPGPGEALVAVRNVGVCGTDVAGYLGRMPFIEYPRILGHELGVEVLGVGPGVTAVRTGDRCSVEPYLNCGACAPCGRGRTNCCETLRVLGVHCDGGLRARITVPAAKLHPGAALDFEQLALVETLGIGAHAVQRGAVGTGDSVLVIGAGPIGFSVIEFAKLAGARCTVLEKNPGRREFVKRQMSIEAVDSLPADFRARVVFDATGHAASMARAPMFAEFGGRVVFVGITRDPVALDDPLLHRRELTLLASRNAVASDFTRIIGLIESARLDTRPWITHRAPFADAPSAFPGWLHPEAGVLKAMIRM